MSLESLRVALDRACKVSDLHLLRYLALRKAIETHPEISEKIKAELLNQKTNP